MVDPEGLSAGGVNESPQEPPGGVLVAMFTQNRVDELAVPVDRSIEVAPAACDSHVCLVQVPGDARLTTALRPKLFGEQGSEPRFPVSYGLVRDLVAALEHQLGDIAEAELVAETPQHGKEHTVGRVLEIVERGPGPLVEDLAARAAGERAVPEGASPPRRLVAPEPQCGQSTGKSSLGRW